MSVIAMTSLETAISDLRDHEGVCDEARRLIDAALATQMEGLTLVDVMAREFGGVKGALIDRQECLSYLSGAA